MNRLLVGAVLVAALLFPTVASAKVFNKCEGGTVASLAQTMKDHHVTVQFTKLNPDAYNEFRDNPGLSGGADARGVKFDAVVIMHNSQDALIILMKGDCIAAVANNTVPWIKLQNALGLIEA
jgi:hypothetical protein